jgi:hypothetical protein
MLRGHLSQAALMRLLHFSFVQSSYATAGHFAALRAFFLRSADSCRALVSSWVTCLASLVAYGLGSREVVVVRGACLVFLAMVLLQKNTLAAWGSEGLLIRFG